jgi:hypothetical protein
MVCGLAGIILYLQGLRKVHTSVSESSKNNCTGIRARDSK